MSLEQQIIEIISQYEKHGWNLSRVLLSANSQQQLPVDFLFKDIPITPAEFDAGWFTRSSRPGQVTWELRTFSGTPFAFLEVIDETEDSVSKNLRLHGVERRMRESRTRRSDA
jgi:hypothetical protein